MQSIQIPATELTVSRLSFGTASLHHLYSAAQRQTLLQTALDNGFTHFDTAPYYGFGLGEVALGQLPTAALQRITIATKVGLYGPDGAGPGMVGMLARKVAGKFLPALNRPVIDWSVARARQSLADSLRRLKRDRVDILYLHEPAAGLIDTHEFQSWLQQARQAGQIGYWGIAGEADKIAAMLAKDGSWPLVQIRDSMVRRDADLLLKQGRELQFTFGYMSDATNMTGSPAQTLAAALERNRTGSILVSTRKTERVAALAQAAA
jgi:aryl-alcohol dehydrogenase-like predicted oxidoreductase